MQTDPNWSNFLYVSDERSLALLDFGATRRFAPEFVRGYRRLVIAASRDDKQEGLLASQDLKYLVGLESEVNETVPIIRQMHVLCDVF